MSAKSVTIFDEHLLENIKAGRNNETTSMLNPDLAKASNDFGTLLHHAVTYGNVDITQHLIELGSEVDAIGKGGKTSLMRAVACGFKEIVRILLNAGARIDITDDSGKSALQTVFERDLFQVSGIFQQFIHRVRADASSIEESSSRLVEAGCTICHAVYLEDVQLLECMRKCGADLRAAVPVNLDMGLYYTPLHIAARVGNEAIAQWLLDNGADVNAGTQLDETPLHLAAGYRNKGLVRLLLERGADPNAESQKVRMTALWITALADQQDRELDHCIECAELLIEYGAIPRNLSGVCITIFDGALSKDRWPMIILLVAHLAMLQRLGTCDAEAVMVCNMPQSPATLERIKNYYKTCQQTLDFVIFGTSTLFDLLSDKVNFSRLRTFVRNEAFGAKVDKVCSEHEIGDRYGHYHKSLMKYIAKARRIVELEDKAIPVICELLEGSYNQCFVFARKVVGYLSERDLEHLILV